MIKTGNIGEKTTKEYVGRWGTFVDRQYTTFEDAKIQVDFAYITHQMNWAGVLEDVEYKNDDQSPITAVR